MRRKDREVTGINNILGILSGCEILRIGLCFEDKPYIVPMNFAHETVDEEVFIYLHSASEGKKIDIISKNSNVCFEADCDYKTLEAEEACGWSAEYQSVMGEGSIAMVFDETQKIKALNLIMKRYGFKGTPRYNKDTLSGVVVLRIAVLSMSAKRRMKNV